MSHNALGRQFSGEPDPSTVHDPSRFGLPLFHGSRAVLQPGEVVEPRSKSIAHATPDIGLAKSFSDDGNLYEVEPVNHDTTWSRTMKFGGGTETVSVDGFRVVRRLDRVPRKELKARTDQAVQDAQAWAERTGGSYCVSCRGWHTPEAAKSIEGHP